MRHLALLTCTLLMALGCSRKDDTPISVPTYGPPQAIVDQIAPCPGPNDAWTWKSGEYRWTGNRYVWEGGKWVSRPSPEARWKPGIWLPRTYGWTLVPGYWY